MGGDHGASVTLPACRSFLDKHPEAELLLVGSAAALAPARGWARCTPVVATEVVSMDDSVETALNLIVSGDPVKSELLASLPGQKLFDQIVPAGESVLDAAVALAAAKANEPRVRVRDLKVSHPNPDAYFQFARNMVKGMAKNFPAPAKCVDAVEQALRKPFDQGMVYERETFIEQFWLRRDPSPDSSENEFKEEHYRRIAYTKLVTSCGCK